MSYQHYYFVSASYFVFQAFRYFHEQHDHSMCWKMTDRFDGDNLVGNADELLPFK